MKKQLVHSLLSVTLSASLLGLYGCGGASDLGGASPSSAFQPDPMAAANAAMTDSPLMTSPGEEEAVPGEFIVKYKEPTTTLQTKDLHLFGATPKKQLPGIKVQVVRLAEGVNLPELQSRVAQDPDIEYIEPNYVRHIFLTPNDPNFKAQYGLTRISAPAAWDLTQGSERVTIAVIDTGIDMGHPDLKAKVARGRNILTDSDNAMDDNGHGTHSSGIAAAITNNATGVAGVAGKVRIMPIKAMDAQGRGDDSTIAEGIIWAADHGADVINLSVGGPQAGRTLAMAVRYALSRNVVIVAAMGNSGRNQRNFPAAYPGVIAVGATDSRDQIARFSDFGSWISVVAPGVRILSTTPTYPVALSTPLRNSRGQVVWPGLKQNYDYLDGTSMSAPFVSGLCGLIRSRFPGLSPAQIKQRLENSADSFGSGPSDPYFGHGRINAAQALA